MPRLARPTTDDPRTRERTTMMENLAVLAWPDVRTHVAPQKQLFRERPALHRDAALVYKRYCKLCAMLVAREVE